MADIPYKTSDIIQTLDDRYQLLEKIGAGGMGTVYKAYDSQLKRWVAVKLLSGWNSIPSLSEVQRLQREAKALAKLDHVNILKLLDFGVGDKTKPFLVMELIEGKSVEQLLKKNQHLPLSGAIMVAIQICDGMAQAHKAGILHRDLKPSNILIVEGEEKDQVKIIDLGLASLESDEQKLTKTGIAVGSPPYMSPEQAKGEQVDARSDIYSLGCLLFAMIAGHPPFHGDTAFDTIGMHLANQPPTLSESRGSEVAAEIEEVVAKCLRKIPSARYQSMDELSEALSEIPEECHVHEAETAEDDKEVASPNLKKTITLSLVALLCIGVVLFLVSFATRVPPKQEVKPLRMSFRKAINEYDKELFDFKNGFCNAHVDTTDEDFKQLEKHPELLSLAIKQSAVTGVGLRYAPATLKRLVIRGSTVTDEGVAQIARFKELDTLELVDCPQVTNKGLATLRSLSYLSNLQYGGESLTIEEFKEISELKKVSILVLYSRKTPYPRGFASLLAKCKKLDTITFQGVLTAENLRELAAFKGERGINIIFRNVDMPVEKLKAISEIPLNSYMFMQCKIAPKALRELANFKKDKMILRFWKTDTPELREDARWLSKAKPKFTIVFNID